MCYLTVFYYAYSHMNRNYSYSIFILLFIAVFLTFSEKTYNIPDNKIVSFLGKFSLPLYLTHWFVYQIYDVFYTKTVMKDKIILIVGTSFIAAAFFMIVKELITKLIRNKFTVSVSNDKN